MSVWRCLFGTGLLFGAAPSIVSARSFRRLGRSVGQRSATTRRTGFTRLNRRARSGVVSGQSSSNVIGIIFARSSSARSSSVNASSWISLIVPSAVFAIIEPPFKVCCKSGRDQSCYFNGFAILGGGFPLRVNHKQNIIRL